jgi:hypothetical protein
MHIFVFVFLMENCMMRHQGINIVGLHSSCVDEVRYGLGGDNHSSNFDKIGIDNRVQYTRISRYERALIGRKTHGGLEVVPVPTDEPRPIDYQFRRWYGLPSILISKTTMENYSNGVTSLEKIFFRDVYRTIDANDVEDLVVRSIHELSQYEWESLRVVRVRAGLIYLRIEVVEDYQVTDP